MNGFREAYACKCLGNMTSVKKFFELKLYKKSRNMKTSEESGACFAKYLMPKIFVKFHTNFIEFRKILALRCLVTGIKGGYCL